MAKRYCPLYGDVVLYLDCLECEEKVCKKEVSRNGSGNSRLQRSSQRDNRTKDAKNRKANKKKEVDRKQMAKKNKIVIGIDQSYQDTGIAIAMNGQIKAISDCFTKNLKSNTEKRKTLNNRLRTIFKAISKKQSEYPDCELICIIERIRLHSAKPGTDSFINIDYIKSIGALNAMIVDLASEFDIPVYSVDTRSWKAQVVGNSTRLSNKFGIDPEKWRTIQFVIHKLHRESDILQPVSNRMKKGIVKVIDGTKYTYNDNKADATCIALYGFCNNQKLEGEH